MSDQSSLTVAALHNGSRLAVFALLCIGALTLVYHAARPFIEHNARLAQQAILLEVLPPDSHDNELLDNTIALAADPLLANTGETTAYLATKNQQPVAVILPVTAAEGYGGAIHLLVGIYRDGRVSGVRVTPPHAETPGLGDKIEMHKSDWILTFNGRQLNQSNSPDWAVKKDGGNFDSFTGATITPRAVVGAVKNALAYFNQHQHELFPPAQTAQISTNE